MSGGVRTFKLKNGGYADVPEDQIDSWMQEMDANGVGFEDAAVSADMQVGAPEVLKSAPPPPAAPEPSMMDRFLGGAKQYGQEFAKAGEGLVRGLNQSLYQGGADEFAAGARAMGGEDFGGALKGEQAARDQAWNDTPLTYGAGRVLGYVPGMMMGAAAGPAKAGWEAVKAAGKRIGANSGMAAVNGFLSDDGDLESRAGSAARDAAIAAPFSAAGELMTKAAPSVDKAGIALRRSNAGGSAGELNAIRQNQGLEHMQSGVDQDFADLGLADSWRPQSAYDVASKLGTKENPGMIQAAGQQMGQALDDAGDAGVRGSWGSVRGLMDNAARRELAGTPAPTTSQRGFVNELGRISADEIPDTTPAFNPGMSVQPGPQMPPVGPGAGPGLADSMVANKANRQIARLNEPAPQFQGPDQDWLSPERIDPSDEFSPFRNVLDEASPRELQTQKNAFEAEAYPKAGTVRPESEAPRAEAYRAAAGAARGELGDVMSGTDFYPGFNQGRETIEKASPIAAMAGARAAANKAKSSFSNPLTWGPAAAGAGLGAAAGGVPGMIGGAVAGGAANYLGRNYGQDIAGMGMRGMSAAMGGGGNLMQGAGRGAGALSSIAGANEPDSDMVSRFIGTQQQPSSPTNALDAGRGHMLTDTVMDMLRNDPQALGQYASQFGQAMGSGGNQQDAIGTLITKLSRTDTNFRTQVLPAIRARTGGM